MIQQHLAFEYVVMTIFMYISHVDRLWLASVEDLFGRFAIIMQEV